MSAEPKPNEQVVDPKPNEMSAEKLEKLYQVVIKAINILETLSHSSSIAADKLINIELRQCLSLGEGTDAARFVHNWARAASASISDKHVEALAKIAKHATEFNEFRGDSISYNELFFSKDERRAVFIYIYICIYI
jgi:hypothetical protein